MLYIVATPIGNLADLSQRALSTLKLVDLILAEDTRHSRKLLQHYLISKPLQAFHTHNEAEQTPRILAALAEGKQIALVSDAGTPLISDPGYRLVAAARAAGVTVSPIPGACAAIAALSVAGLPSDRFVFEGFLPAKTSARVQTLEALQKEPRTLIFYEAPHRILASLKDCVEVLGGERQAVIARELTKHYEKIQKASLNELLQWLREHDEQQQGEFVLLIAGQEKSEATAVSADKAALENLLSLLQEEGLPIKQAVRLASRLTGIRKNQVYALALQLDQNKISD